MRTTEAAYCVFRFLCSFIYVLISRKTVHLICINKLVHQNKFTSCWMDPESTKINTTINVPNSQQLQNRLFRRILLPVARHMDRKMEFLCGCRILAELQICVFRSSYKISHTAQDLSNFYNSVLGKCGMLAQCLCIKMRFVSSYTVSYCSLIVFMNLVWKEWLTSRLLMSYRLGPQ